MMLVMVAQATADPVAVHELVSLANWLFYYTVIGLIYAVLACALIGFAWFLGWLLTQLEA